MKTISKRTKYILIYFLLVVFFLAGLVMPANRTVFAGESLQDFEYMETAENLYECRNYDDVTLIRFYENEYGRESKYSLSFYIYNPNRVNFATDKRNNVQIGYANNYTDVFRSQYKKYTITKDGQSETGLFVRFKISGFNMPIDVDRFYCISGIELVTAGDQNATEYAVSAVYQCNTINNITTISTSTLPTCEVDVNHTYYRSNVSSKGDFWNNQLSMCYFALPKNISGIGNYGTLEAITAEFYNYYTKRIFITSEKEAYEEYIKNYVGVDIRERDEAITEFYVGYKGGSTGILSHDYYYQGYSKYPGNTVVNFNTQIWRMWWFFYDEIKEDEPGFDSEEYKFSGEYLRTYFYNYSLEHGRNQAILDLFVSENEYKEEKLGLTGFDYGYNKHTYSIAKTPSNEDDVFGFNFRDNGWKNIFGTTISEVKEVVPLIKIDTGDLYLTDEKFSKKYYIEENEVPDIKAYVVQQSALNKETWILRYDVCEYYGAPAHVGVYGFNFPYNGLLAQESVYLDFDILSFRFAQESSKYTIAVNMSPEDVFNDITGAKQPLSWWEKLLDWLKGLFGSLAAWGFFVLMTAAGLLGLWFILKFIRYIYDISQNWVVRLLTFLVFFAITFTIYYFYIRWVISVIASLGGLW